MLGWRRLDLHHDYALGMTTYSAVNNLKATPLPLMSSIGAGTTALAPVGSLRATPLPQYGTISLSTIPSGPVQDLRATPLPEFLNGGDGPLPIVGGIPLFPVNPLPGGGGGGGGPIGYPIDS